MRSRADGAAVPSLPENASARKTCFFFPCPVASSVVIRTFVICLSMNTRPSFRPFSYSGGVFLKPRRSVCALVASLALLAVLPACSPPPPAATAPLPSVSPLPPELTRALDAFRAEGPRGWAFTQTTSGAGKERVERYDPRQRGSARWTLLLEQGVPPTEEEQRRYRDTRPPFDSSADLAAQLDRTSVELFATDATRSTYQFRLRPGSEDDKAAAHMRAHFVLDHATGAFSRVEVFTTGPFKPATSLTIDSARTTILYAPPTDTAPALPKEVSMQVQGKRFWIREFEEKVVSTYSDQENAAIRPGDNPAAPAR